MRKSDLVFFLIALGIVSVGIVMYFRLDRADQANKAKATAAITQGQATTAQALKAQEARIKALETQVAQLSKICGVDE